MHRLSINRLYTIDIIEDIIILLTVLVEDLPRRQVAWGSSHRWAEIFLHSSHLVHTKDSEDSDSLLYWPCPS